MVKNPKSIEQETSAIDQYKTYFKLFIKNWHWIGLSLLISLMIGFLFTKSTTPQYKNSLTMLLSEKKRDNRNSGDLMQFGMFDVQGNIEDELGVISSFPLVNKTLKELNLIVSYYSKTGFITSELYKDSPFTVMIEHGYSQPVEVMFELEIVSSDRFRISAKSEDKINLINYAKNERTGILETIDFNQEFGFGDEIQISNTKFKILLNGNYNSEVFENKKLFFKFNDLDYLTLVYQRSLKVERTSLQSALVTLEFKGGNSVLVSDFLNNLAVVYLDRNLEKKNQIANRTIQFIEGQISEVADSLGYTSDKLKNFRAKNNVMNIDYLSQSVNEQMLVLENQKAILMVKSKYYDYIKEYFENNKELTDLLAPSAMGVEDPQLTSLINQLTTANAERSLYLDGKSFKNPNLPNLNAKINNLKKTILENIDYIVNTSNITINDIDNRIAKLNREVYNLPSIEKELQIIQRDFSLNDAIYTFLLTKRSESQIARASNSPDYEIIVPSNRISAIKVAPNKKIILLAALFLGLMIPIGVIVISFNFNDSIFDKREVEKLSNFPIIGTIARNDKRSMLPILDAPKSMIAESFRSVRTSLQFFQKGLPKQKILVTSSMSGEGKTFIALNLAAAFSYYGKKTLLLEFDLRNPKIAEYMSLDGIKGLSSYLINDARLEDIIQKSHMKNLDIIPAGEVPPNPVELIASDNTQNLIEILQSIYEYIVIDSPPIGMVTDSYLIMDYSDANIFTVRLKYSDKKLFTSLLKDLEQKEIPNLGILINDDEEKTNSIYYDEEGGKVSYFMKKFNTFKTLIKSKKRSPVA
ncbi:MAG: polysaccharide biosynthesis tyrosine autokinase [Bacteroidales bacterium]|nr:polysaccharide biosynthesis tyrosine autokinase [Bacteroidales bacterium]